MSSIKISWKKKIQNTSSKILFLYHDLFLIPRKDNETLYEHYAVPSQFGYRLYDRVTIVKKSDVLLITEENQHLYPEYLI